MVFQSYALFPHMTVGENIEFALQRAQGARARAARGVAERSLELVQLDGMATGRSRRCRAASSSGSRSPARWRRTRACCCSTSRWPRSTSSCASSMQVEIKRIQQEVGVTTVAVTHDQTEAMTMSDRVAIMRDGGIEQIDTPEDAVPPARDACSPRGSSARRTCCPVAGRAARRLRRAGAGAQGPRSCGPRSSCWSATRRAGCAARCASACATASFQGTRYRIECSTRRAARSWRRCRRTPRRRSRAGLDARARLSGAGRGARWARLPRRAPRTSRGRRR